MKLQFLGTGAADWPNPGKQVGNGRRFCSLVLNDHILIDCNIMTLDAIEEFNVDINRLTDVIISHPHDDHFRYDAICDIARRRSPDAPALTLHVSAKALERCTVQNDLADRLILHGFLPEDNFDLHGETILALESNHPLEIPGEIATHLYITAPNDQRLFYELDSGWLRPRAWNFLRKNRMDVVVWELTCGNLDDWRLYCHSNFAMISSQSRAFRQDGTIHAGTTQFCSHMARTLCPPHDIHAREIGPQGFILAKDGMVWEG